MREAHEDNIFEDCVMPCVRNRSFLQVLFLLTFYNGLSADCCIPKNGVCPTLVTRKEWGARPPKAVEYLKEPVIYAFVHHTSHPSECYTKKDCINKMRIIQNFHMDTRGWDDIGYSFVLGDDGNVYEGRGWDRVGAHTKHYNSIGLGFSVMGNFTSKLPSSRTRQLLKNMFACGVSKGKIKTNYVLRGHRDMDNYTSCPGERFYQEIRTWPHY